MIQYEDLERHFIAPKVISPFYRGYRVPRKLKKKASNSSKYLSHTLNIGQKLWYYLYFTNENYHRFLIKQICKNYEIHT